MRSIGCEHAGQCGMAEKPLCPRCQEHRAGEPAKDFASFVIGQAQRFVRDVLQDKKV